jgi:hypothetical protein
VASEIEPFEAIAQTHGPRRKELSPNFGDARDQAAAI